ncbi:hypothetical protein FVR03_18875 [Pontibacter qinzhouensis]|uniref:Uncharacterized protein n=1 Tax=Pontibacter qinzhouensis TaxID=2603253 RepID=A0A5C8J8P8_9BACT|nr:hypothetical protein [Pontibacter qinzhouensis]TXK33768.1 hypothetical protein FVR03_18875 [Pontibacter qinzhouensis]
MFWRRFNWLILSFFIIQAFLPPKHFVNSAFYNPQPVFVSDAVAQQEEEDASPLELMLEEYLELIEESPRKDLGRVGKTRSVKLVPEAILNKVDTGPSRHFTPSAGTPLAYKALGFLLSEYHGYLFRLTPF